MKKNYIDLFSKELFPEKDAWMKNKDNPRVKIVDSSGQLSSININDFKTDYDKIIFHNTKEASSENIKIIQNMKSELIQYNQDIQVLIVLERKE